MISGNNLWFKEHTSDMVSLNLEGHTFFTYPNLPPNLYEVLYSAAKLVPNKVALVDSQENSVTYCELLTKVDAFSAYLANFKGITKGSQVAIMLYNSVEFCVSFLSICKLGGISILLPTKFKQSEILSLLSNVDANMIICDSDFLCWFQNWEHAKTHLLVSNATMGNYGLAHYFTPTDAPIVANASFEDAAIILFTSGTTSQSKGVVLKNYNIMHAIVSYQRLLGITSKDISIIPIPMYHVTGLIALFGLFLYVHGTLFLHKYFDSVRVLETVQKNKITFFHASPTVFSFLLQHFDEFPTLPHLKTLVCGSGNMPKEKIKQIHQWLPNSTFHTVYGLTETTSPATIFPMDVSSSSNIGSSGLPIPGADFKILDENAQEVPAFTIGEIVIRGTMVFSHYYNLRTNFSNDDGWLKTGDLGYFNTENFLFVVDRKKDMINRGGEKIWSSDIENELYHIPGIIDAAVVGIPDHIYGETAVAIVVLSHDSQLTELQIQELLKPKIAKYKIPSRILIVDRIPLTKNLKTDKVKIKTLFTNL